MKHIRWLYLSNVVSVALVLFLTACGQPNENSQVSTADGQGGLVLPFAITSLPNSADLHASLDCPSGTSVSMTVNKTDNTVFGKCDGVEVGVNQTFTIHFTYGASQLELAHASKTIDVVAGSNPPISFAAADYIKPDDDNDGFTNLDEIAAGTNPELPNYSVDVTVDSLPFTISSLSNPADLTATLDCPDGTSVSLNTDAVANKASGNCTGLMTNLVGTGSQAFTFTFTDSSTNTVLASGSKYSDVVQGNNPVLNVTAAELTGTLSNLIYATNPANYIVNQAIIANVPHNDGGAVESYSVSPALPAGLSLDVSSGTISGTPTAITATANYTVTATNASGSTTATLIVTVSDVAPSNLAYSTNPAVYTINQAIATNSPSSGSIVFTSYAVSPSLPAGLSLNATTGEITGTPTAITPTATYVVTASNAQGSTTANLSITVNDVPPSSLSYASPVTYTVNKGYSNTPSHNGGVVVSYSVSPALPAGLSLDTGTGVISGTPTAVTATATYVVTGTNSGGSTTANVSITVNDVAPGNLSYSANPSTYTANQAITSNVPSNTGGTVVSYSVTPNLPVGLSLDAGTGVITGTPTEITSGNYTVTALNSGGQTTATLTISVKGDTVGVKDVIAAGAYHSCVLVDGGIMCWGYNAYGQLGDGTVSTRGTPMTVSGISNGASAVVAGLYHTCALINGGIKCWGANSNGQLGNGATSFNSSTPQDVSGLSSGVQEIAAGYDHTCALANGAVYCWGRNDHGQLGNNTTTDSNVPVAVTGLGSGVQAIVAGGFHTCAIVNGGMQCWGYNYKGQLGNNSLTDSPLPVGVTGLSSGVQQIVAGYAHTCALVNGGVQCWGRNDYGQVGDNTLTNTSIPVAVSGLSSGVHSIMAGDYHTCALVDGGMQCWGYNIYGQLGDGTTTNSTVPIAVTSLVAGVQTKLSGVEAMIGGYAHTCALVSGSLQCWGYNNDGQLGDGTTTDSPAPLAVAGLATARQMVVAGGSHTCTLVMGDVWCWGDNSYGQLGDGTKISSNIPVKVNGLAAGVQSVVAGVYHTCVLVNGGVQCWGRNNFGQLGDATTTDNLVPVSVSGLSGGVQAIIAGAFDTCALVNGGVQCWGYNGHGQLGDGTTTDSSIPVSVSGLSSNVQAVAAGYEHTCALIDGGLQCWGYNFYGELGDGSTTDSSVPVPVSGLSSNVQAVAAGLYHTCAVVDGAAQCWGYNSYGQLGNSSTTNSSIPVSVTGLTSGVQSIDAGYEHSCALVNGGVHCWGYNVAGQLGDGTTTNNSAPVSVIGLSAGVQELVTGENHTCALVNGNVECWGYNLSGQLGNGAQSDSSTPVAVNAAWP